MYYLVMIYIKIRISLINNSVIQINKTTYLKRENFINFYDLENNFFQKYSFKNIFPIFPKNEIGILKFKEKLPENIKHISKFVAGIFLGGYVVTWYFDFVDKIDGIFGIRTNLIENLNKKISLAKSFQLNSENSNDDYFILEKLKQKVNKLKLVYFLKSENIKKIEIINSLVKQYIKPNSGCLDELQDNEKTLS